MQFDRYGRCQVRQPPNMRSTVRFNKRISAKEALDEIKIIKNDIITRNIFSSINNDKIENYFNSISKKLNILSLS